MIVKDKNRIIRTMMPLLAFAVLIPQGINAQMVPGDDDDRYGSVGVVDELAVLDSVLEYYKDILMEEDHTQQKITENLIDRLEIARAIYQSTNGQEVDDRYADKTPDELLVLLDKTYNSEDFVESSSSSPSSHTGHGPNPVPMPITHSHTSSSSIDVYRNNNHFQRQYDCEEGSYVTGSALSTLTSYTNGRATISGTFDYPENFDKNIREGRTTECIGFDHVETVKRHDVLAGAIPGSGHIQSQVCTLRADSASDTVSVGCNAFGPNRLVLITTVNEYDSDETTRNTQLGSMQTTLMVS